MDPRPDMNDRLLWGIERDFVKPVKRSQSKFGFVTSKFLSVIMLIIFAGSLWKSLPRNELGSILWSDVWTAYGWYVPLLIVIFIVSRFSRFFGKPRPSLNAMPLWLSSQDLAYVPSNAVYGTVLSVAKITSASLDYVEGSLAVHVQSGVETVKLFSSDANNLLHHLYTLRPDLEPTS
ncbi:MAG: hypothetical protein ABJO36_02290 [Litorimonas sp.]